VFNKMFVNWKTTVAGVAALGMLGGFWMRIITAEQFLSALGVIAAGGFCAAKDCNVTGGTKQQ
jgi:hypothetical protein